MKILIASTPASGHLNPLLSVGRAAQSQGHEVVALCAHALRGLIEASGVTFRPFPPVADFDMRNMDTAFPGFTDVNPGPDRNLFLVKKAFIDTIPAQHEAMQQVLHDFPADIILADDTLYGALPMLLGPRSERPPIVILGVMPLLLSRDDGAPPAAGLPPATNAAQRAQYKAVFKAHHTAFLGPIGVEFQACLLSMGIEPPAMPWFDTPVLLPDAFLQLTAPGFEFPRENLPSSVRHVGTLPIMANQAPLPPWAADVYGSHKVALVTQGTFSNHDFTELVTPTLAALADEADLLVVATAGGRSSASIPGPIPDNARLADYLPLEWLFPHVDVLVTNGGYGTVNQALSHGVPIVAAGGTEDKPDVGARVAWSGAGIDLQAVRPKTEALRAAVRSVLDDPSYGLRAEALATEFAAVDTTAEILSVLTELAGVPAY